MTRRRPSRIRLTNGQKAPLSVECNPRQPNIRNGDVGVKGSIKRRDRRLTLPRGTFSLPLGKVCPNPPGSPAR